MKKFRGSNDYVASGELMNAVNVAIALEKPLLIKGEPGTGKTGKRKQRRREHRTNIHTNTIRNRSRKGLRIDTESKSGRMRPRQAASRSRKYRQKRPRTTGSASQYRQISISCGTSHLAGLQTATETASRVGRRAGNGTIHPGS